MVTMHYPKNSPLRKYVSVRKNKDVKTLTKAGFGWVKAALENKLSYELDWLGMPIIQSAEDIMLMQELVFSVRPDVIVETGVAHGGSLVFYASLLELLNPKKGRVIGIDIDIRKHNRKALEKHPLFKRIKLLQGDSAAPEMLARVKKLIPAGSKVLVCLDANHMTQHVLKELNLYSPLVKKGSYIVVFDTMVGKLADSADAPKNYKQYIGDNPLEAVKKFLRTNKNFAIDEHYNKLFVSYSPDGYLKRIR